MGMGTSEELLQTAIALGPKIESINNNMGIGFGLDWAHFGDACYNVRGEFRNWRGDCSMNDFWLPVVWNWSFFFSDLISAFIEPGLAIEHTRWDGGLCNGDFCPYGKNDTDLEFVLWLGVRFHLSDEFALVIRLGHPSLNFGPAFLL